MRCLPLRLGPGADLCRSLASAEGLGTCSAFVLSGLGSLIDARLRLAGADADAETLIPGPSEILNLSGTLTPDGVHLHMAIADARGRVIGGHVVHGNTVRTTVEVLLAALDEWQLGRAHDPATGYSELTSGRHLRSRLMAAVRTWQATGLARQASSSAGAGPTGSHYRPTPGRARRWPRRGLAGN